MTGPLTGIALELAAVTGAFDPAALAEAAGAPEAGPHRAALWREIGSAVTELLPGDEGSGGRYGWILRPDARRAQLARFLTPAQLDRALALAPPPRPGDAFGQMLHAILSRQTPTLADAQGVADAVLLERMRQNAAIFDAAQVALAVPALDGAALSDLALRAHHHVQQIQRRRDLVAVLPRRHYGYESVRRRISSFLRGETPDVRPMLLTGLGGMGKSALLARILAQWQGHEGAPVTVVLDFDRRQLNAGEPVELVKELTRQIEAGLHQQVPEIDQRRALAEGLARLRRDLPKFTATRAQRTHVSQLGYLASILPRTLAQDWASPLRRLPIALVLDSFEALHNQGVGAVDLVLDLEAMLRETGFRGLRSVVSGRAAPLDEAGILARFGGQARHVALDGLAPAAAAALLADEDVRLAGPGGPLVLAAPELRLRVAEALQGHPLALLIFAKYARNHQGDIKGLVETLDAGKGFGAAFAQVFLYERILDRIDDPGVEALAHPGLVLRQLNTDLLRFVLAGPCFGRGPEDPRPLSDAEAQDLLDRLRQEYWLVEEGAPPFALRHRADLRRMMMDGLFAGAAATDSAEQAVRKEDLRRRALAACALAARYFRAGPGPSDAAAQARHAALDPGLREIEALYYKALAEPDAVPVFDAATAARLSLGLGEDADTLPPAWRARLKALLGRQVAEHERAMLSPELREETDRSGFRRRIKTGLSRSAAPPPRPETAGLAEPLAERSVPALARRLQEAFAAAEFGRAMEIVPRFLAQFVAGIEDPSAPHLPAGDIHSALWLCLLLAGTGHADPVVLQEAAAPVSVDGYLLHRIRLAIASAQRGEPQGLPQMLRFLLPPELARSVLGYRFFLTSGAAAAQVSPSALSLAAARPVDDAPSFWSREVMADLADLAKAPSLAGIEQVYARMAVLAFEVTRAQILSLGFAVYRGLTPELHEPLGAILAALPADQALDVLAVAAEAALWPVELRFASAADWRPLQAPTVVEIADQCGRLRDLAARMALHDPRATTAVEIHDAVTRWFFPKSLA